MNNREPETDVMKVAKSWFERLWGVSSPNRRRQERPTTLPLIAYYWDGSTPIAHGIRDINAVGIYLLTEQRWYPGTIIMMTIQRVDCALNDPDRSISLRAKVARFGEDGVGLSFVRSETQDCDYLPGAQTTEADAKTLGRFLQKIRKSRDQK